MQDVNSICRLGEALKDIASLHMGSKPILIHFMCWPCGLHMNIEWEGNGRIIPEGWELRKILREVYDERGHLHLDEHATWHCSTCAEMSVGELLAAHDRKHKVQLAERFGVERARAWKRNWKYADES